jgi:YVTN family beta-propeller protein
VTVIDNETREVKKKITFEVQGLRAETIQPVGVRITADGAKAYVALGPANRVAVVDTKTYEVKKYILVGQRVWQLGFTPDQKQIISTNGVSNDITFIDVATDEPTQSVTVGKLPWGVVVKPQ